MCLLALVRKSQYDAYSMCGINGFTWEDEPLVTRMNEVTKHRGPDGMRTQVLPGVTFGFNRLAIIDLDMRAMQPMQDASGRYTLVFNGELYNFKELRTLLEASYTFKTESDTEVILAAYARWGKESFSKFNGMFALALFDSENAELILARDSGGIKPLYYHQHGGKLMFSSEVTALLEAGVPRKLDVVSLGYYLRLKYVPGPRTMVDGVQKLLPGNMLVWKAGGTQLIPFKFLGEETERFNNYADAVTQVHSVVEAAIQRQLIADVPVGLYLSGGIDSSIILAAAAKTHPAINTFSVGFDLSSLEQREKFNADSILAKKTANHFGATHHEFILSSEELLRIFPDMVRHVSEPIGNATTLAQYYLAQKTKEFSSVVLAGDGGDELFGGYERYRLAHLAQRFGTLLPPLHFFEKYHLTGVNRFAQLMFEKETVLSRILAQDDALPNTSAVFETYFKKGDIATELMNTDEKNWLIDEALLRADNMSMASSLEVRVPFLDEEVKRIAHNIPRKWKVDGRRTKKILKDAFGNVLPQELLHQPKRGWFSPGAKWLRRNDFAKFSDEVFSKGYVPHNIAMLFNMDGIKTLLEEHRSKGAYHYTLLWSLLVFFVWVRENKIQL